MFRNRNRAGFCQTQVHRCIDCDCEFGHGLKRQIYIASKQLGHIGCGSAHAACKLCIAHALGLHARIDLRKESHCQMQRPPFWCIAQLLHQIVKRLGSHGIFDG